MNLETLLALEGLAAVLADVTLLHRVGAHVSREMVREKECSWTQFAEIWTMTGVC